MITEVEAKYVEGIKRLMAEGGDRKFFTTALNMIKSMAAEDGVSASRLNELALMAINS